MEVRTAPATATVMPPIQRSAYRIEAIDFLRGLVMVIMALDHTRDFFHREAFTDDPLNLATTTPFLFFTRWITHFCAPIFVFLAGTSGFFQSLRKSKKELSGFLIKRGLWLIAIEVFIMSFAFSFDVAYRVVFFQTIWSIGISMIFLGLAIWLPFRAILALGLLIVFGHNLLDFAERNHQGPFPYLWEIAHRPTPYQLGGNHTLFILYPFLPWTGLMLLGFCFGKLYHSTPLEKRVRMLTLLGGGLILFFIALRATNAYGDPDPWSVQKNATLSFLSFLNVHKYPPSLLFMCMTIGPGLLFLAWLGNVKTWFSRVITVFGRVPFFYYILHFYVLHLVAMLLFLTRHSFREGIQPPGFPSFNFILPGEGYGLGIVYLVWFLVIVALYPLCKWFSRYKQTHRHWWLSYL